VSGPGSAAPSARRTDPSSNLFLDETERQGANAMLMQTDPFRDFDTLFNRLSSRQPNGAGVMPMDAFRRGSDVWVQIDLPGVKSENLDITVERNVLTIAAERDWQRQDGDQQYFGERYRGAFRRQIQLGDGLDLNSLEADLHDGVLTIRVPVAEQAKPRKVEVGQRQTSAPEAIETTSATS
jgi:HSP20 family protein